MAVRIDRELDPAFDLHVPGAISAPILFSSPHSGRVYTRSFLLASRLDAKTLRRSEDCFVDRLFDGVVDLGAPLLCARFPRAYLDVNREPFELDPRMFRGKLPPHANTRSMRVAGGLGTIARIVADQQEIYGAPIAVEDALARIEYLYKPYHNALASTLASLGKAFGTALLVDCHSMPSTAANDEEMIRPDFVLGDRYGTSCAPTLTDAAQVLLEDMGYSVRRNKPYAGGYITERYGNPARGIHALQIEINRGIYLDESNLEPRTSFESLRSDLMRLAERLMEMIRGGARTFSEAAE